MKLRVKVAPGSRRQLVAIPRLHPVFHDNEALFYVRSSVRPVVRRTKFDGYRFLPPIPTPWRGPSAKRSIPKFGSPDVNQFISVSNRFARRSGWALLYRRGKCAHSFLPSQHQPQSSAAAWLTPQATNIATACKAKSLPAEVIATSRAIGSARPVHRAEWPLADPIFSSRASFRWPGLVRIIIDKQHAAPCSRRLPFGDNHAE